MSKFKLETTAVYSPQHKAKGEEKENEYVTALKELAELKNKDANYAFENEGAENGLKKFKYAASKLKEQGLYFTFRKHEEHPETHSRVWALLEAPAPRATKKKEAETTDQPKEGEEKENALKLRRWQFSRHLDGLGETTPKLSFTHETWGGVWWTDKYSNVHAMSQYMDKDEVMEYFADLIVYEEQVQRITKEFNAYLQ